MARGLDVVLHVAHEQRLPRGEFVLLEDFQNLRPLVPNLYVGVVEEPIKAGRRRLSREMVAMNGAQQQSAQTARAAKDQHIARVRQFPRQVLDLAEMAVKPLLQLRQWNVWNVAAVEVFERKAKRGPKLLERQFHYAGLFKSVIGRPPHRRQIVHQRPGPIKDHGSNHPPSLVPPNPAATRKP